MDGSWKGLNVDKSLKGSSGNELIYGNVKAYNFRLFSTKQQSIAALHSAVEEKINKGIWNNLCHLAAPFADLMQLLRCD